MQYCNRDNFKMAIVSAAMEGHKGPVCKACVHQELKGLNLLQIISRHRVFLVH
jgi:hypothetical protein